MEKKWPIIVIAVLAAIGLIVAIPASIAFVAMAAFVIFILNHSRKKAKEEEAERRSAEQARLKEKSEKEAACKAEEAARELEQKKKEEEVEKELARRIRQFNTEIEAIPRVEIAISMPVPRKYLKDMPDYEYSNITRTTKLSSIFPLVVLDVETTGLKAAYGEILEIAAIKFDAGMIPTACFATLCKPKKPIPPEITKINGITDEMVDGKPNFHEIAPALSRFLEGCHLVGHNLEFDLEFLHVHGTELPFDKKLYDTLELAQRTIKKSDIWNHKLDTLCSWYGIHRDGSHRALSDCYATSKIFTQLVFDKTSRMLDDGTTFASDSDT